MTCTSAGSRPESPFDAADLPITDLVMDDLTRDLYAATDFGVVRGRMVSPGVYAWTRGGVGLPKVETPGLTVDPCARVLYAATHGRSIWRMALPDANNGAGGAGRPQVCPRTP